MEKRDIASQAEKYKREMMNIYGKSNTIQHKNNQEQKAVPTVNVNVEAEPRPEATTEPERKITPEPLAMPEPEPESEKIDESENMAEPEMIAEDEIRNEPESVSGPEKETETSFSEYQNEANFNERYPEPDVSEFRQSYVEDNSMDYQHIEEEIKNKDTAKGYIKVNVRTGDDAEPLENAWVVVTRLENGKRLFIGAGASDESGSVPVFEVPVPQASYSLIPENSRQPYSLYDITVMARGFFNERSVDIPVFDSITSVQNFSMIPVPLYMTSNEETVTIFNQEPNL